MQIECTDFKEREGANGLIGFATLRFPELEMVIYGCPVFEGEREGIGFPGKSYTNASGKTSYTPMVKITGEMDTTFQKRALAAVRSFRNDHRKRSRAELKPKGN